MALQNLCSSPPFPLLLASCTVGPKLCQARGTAYIGVQGAGAGGLTGTPAFGKPAHPSDGRLRAHWWELFGDEAARRSGTTGRRGEPGSEGRRVPLPRGAGRWSAMPGRPSSRPSAWDPKSAPCVIRPNQPYFPPSKLPRDRRFCAASGTCPTRSICGGRIRRQRGSRPVRKRRPPPRKLEEGVKLSLHAELAIDYFRAP